MEDANPIIRAFPREGFLAADARNDPIVNPRHGVGIPDEMDRPIRQTMAVSWLHDGPPLIDFDFTAGLSDDVAGMSADHIRSAEFLRKYRNEVVLSEFLKVEIPKRLVSLQVDPSSIRALECLDEFARGQHTQASLCRSLERLSKDDVRRQAEYTKFVSTVSDER
ncbi:Uncharacterized protein PBTT_09000 [Plasmodiophora brassicae]